MIAITNKINNYIDKEDAKFITELTGRSYYALAIYDSAIYFENRALSLDNDASGISAWAYTYRGLAKYHLGKKEESIADLQKAVNLNKGKACTDSAREFLSEVYANSVPDDSCQYFYSQGAYKDAIANGRRQLQKRDYKRIAEIVGASYFNIHNYDSAIYYERKALDLDRDSTFVSGWAHTYMGIALFNKNDKEGAIAELRKAIELDKSSKSVNKAENFLNAIINGRSVAIDSSHQVIKDLLDNKNYRDAANRAISLLAANQDDAVSWDQLSTAYCWLHQYDSSIYCGQKAIMLDKEQSLISCEAHYHIGIDKFMQHDRKDADDEFKAATNEHINDNLKKRVKHTRLLMGIDDLYDPWKTVETDHMIFHFQNKKNIDNIESFIAGFESEYSKANKILPIAPPKKIDVFVWANELMKKKTLQTNENGPYANYDLCMIHIPQNTNGESEILHILGYWQKQNRKN